MFGKNNKSSSGFLSFGFAIVFMIALVELATPQGIKLNELSGVASRPRVVALGKSDVAVVWQGQLGERQRIFLRQRVDGVWSEERLVDSGLEGDHLRPQAVADRYGIHLAWVHRYEGIDTINYARIINGVAENRETQSLTRGVYCEYLSIAPDGLGRARIAFQAKYAGGISVDLLEFDTEGEMTLSLLSPDDAPLTNNRFPQVFQFTLVQALWYQSHEQGYRLTGAIPVGETKWRLAPVEDLFESLNPQRTPAFYEGPDGQLIALWHDSRSGVDRIMLSRPGDPAEQPEIVDSRPGRNNWLPAGAISMAGEIAIVWVGETEAGSAIFLKLRGAEETHSLSGEQTTCAFPQVAFSQQGRLHVAWQTDRNHTGAGDIYFTEISR
jgi:hypothetical protein